MTLYLETAEGFTPWDPSSPIGGVRYPPNIEQLWSSSALAELGLHVPEPADPKPPGKIVTGTTVSRVNGVVRLVHTLEDLPPTSPSDYPLTDRQLRLGLIGAGILPSTVETTIKSIPDPLQREAAWTWFDRTTLVHWDHPMTQSLLTLAGFTHEQAAAMWMAAKDLEA